MLAYLAPVALVVISNVFYQVCAKSSPAAMDPLAAVTVTYVVGALISSVLYYLLGRGDSLVREMSHLNWAPFALAFCIVGLEAGNILAYRAGWQVSTLQVMQGAFAAIGMLAMGYLLFHEPLTYSKLLGIVICMLGLYVINR